MNEGLFKGRITKLVDEFSTFGKEYVEVKFATKRFSDKLDEFNVVINKSVYKNLNLDKFIELHGSIRSKNYIENGKSKLKVYVYSENIFNIDEEAYENKVKFDGFLVKNPNLRETPFHRVICDFLVANNNLHKRSYYLPCIAWESNANFVSKFKPNHKEQFVCEGRLQSRVYEKVLPDGNIEKKVAYEISISNVEVNQNDSEA